MNRFSLSILAFILGAWLLTPAPGNASCFCPSGTGTTLWSTTWGAVPGKTCADLSSVAHNSAFNYAQGQCAYGVCYMNFSNEACVDQGFSQHWDLQFTYKCYSCSSAPQ